MGREEKGEREDRGDPGGEKGESKGERVIKPIITLLSTDDWILKGTKLITNTK